MTTRDCPSRRLLWTLGVCAGCWFVGQATVDAQQERMARNQPLAPSTSFPPPSASVVEPTPQQPQRPGSESRAVTSIPLAPPGVMRAAGDTNERSGTRRATTGPSWLSIFTSLAAVVALFLGATYVLRKSLPAAATVLPKEVVEVLGRTPLGGRQSAHLIRLGNKLLLVNVTTSGAETLTEVTDPLEVDRLAGLCRAAQPNSSTDTFQRVLQQFAREKPAPGFFGTLANSGTKTPTAALAAEDDDDV